MCPTTMGQQLHRIIRLLLSQRLANFNGGLRHPQLITRKTGPPLPLHLAIFQDEGATVEGIHGHLELALEIAQQVLNAAKECMLTCCEEQLKHVQENGRKLLGNPASATSLWASKLAPGAPWQEVRKLAERSILKEDYGAKLTEFLKVAQKDRQCKSELTWGYTSSNS